MVKVQLLFLLALAGPFCAIARASTLVSPSGPGHVTDATDALGQGAPITDAPQAETKTAADEVMTEIAPATKADTEVAPKTATEAAPEATEATAMMSEAPVVPTDNSEQEMPTTKTPDIVEEPMVETKQEEEEEGLVEEPEEGIGSGQVAGIVIGALVAVIIVIAVVIVVVRRMGKYSP